MQINIVLKALSHPIRRDVIARLQKGPLTAGDLAEKYGISKPSMSSHFSVLKDAELVRAERDGVSIRYHLNATVAEEALGTLMDVLKIGNTAGSAATAPRKEPS